MRYNQVHMDGRSKFLDVFLVERSSALQHRTQVQQPNKCTNNSVHSVNEAVVHPLYILVKEKMHRGVCM